MSLLSRVTEALTGTSPVVAEKAAEQVGTYTGIDSDSAYGMLTAIFPGSVGAPPDRTVPGFLRAYNEMPWLRAAVHKVSSSVASTTWRLYVVRGGNGKLVRPRTLQRAAIESRTAMLHRYAKAGQLQEIESHPLLDLLDSTNAFLVGLSTRKLTQTYMDLVGEAFWIKERNGAGAPVAVWPIPPSWISDLPTASDPFYQISFRGWQGRIPDTEMVWFQDPDPENPYARGTGIAKALSDELDIDEYAAKWMKSFFYNRARPDLIVAGEGLAKADTDRLEQNWMSKNQGFWKAFKPYFLNKAVKVTQLNQNLETTQGIPLRQAERDTIIQVFGVPPEILGILANSNRATIDAADYIYSRWVLVPRLELFRAHLQERLVPEYDDRLILTYESPIQEDKAQKLQIMQAAPWTYQADEWRQFAGFEELPEGAGRVYFVPGTGTITDVLESPPPPEPAPAPVPPADDGTSGDSAPAADAAPPLLTRSAKYLNARYKWFHRKDEDGNDPIARVAETLEPEFRSRFTQAIAAAKGKINVDNLIAAIQDGSISGAQAVLGLEDLEEGLSGTRRIIGAGLIAAGEVEASLLGQAIGVTVRFDKTNPEAVKWINEYSFEMVKGISDASRQAIRSILLDAFESGLAPRDQAKLIVDQVGLTDADAKAVARFRSDLAEQGISSDRLLSRVERYADSRLRQRAVTIARTETLRASNEGQEQLWKQAVQADLIGDNATKDWITTPDDRLDTEICEPIPHMAENSAVPIGGNFLTGHGSHVAGPPAHPRCRCTKALKFKD